MRRIQDGPGKTTSPHQNEPHGAVVFFRKHAGIAVRILDVILINTTLLLACQLYFDMHAPANHLVHVYHTAPIATILFYLFFSIFGIYKVIWRYASVDAALQIGTASLAGAFSTYLVSFIAYSISSDPNVFLMPRPVYLLFWLLSMLLMGGTRLLARMRYQARHGGGMIPSGNSKRVMVVGAGWAGSSVIRDIQAGRYGSCKAVCVVDNDPVKKGARLMNVPVVPDTSRIHGYVREYDVQEIIIAIIRPHGELRPLMEACVDTGCRVRMVSALLDVKTGQSALGNVRDVQISDLIGREEKHLDMRKVSDMFHGRCVLITGGGGSIGAELCRQIMSFAPEKIILFDISENYMYDLFFELKALYGPIADYAVILCVGSVTDAKRLDEVFLRYSPEIILHAAAHKHVPLMEVAPGQAVRNNVFGTYETVQAALRHHVKRFVMISTDKAVNPTSVMGATKRLAEMLIQAMQDHTAETQFTAVRFGNVLGSHGSVVPIFEKQIKRGGPITLTHPEVERYFMTIPEAASLVLQAASIAIGGELFVLDMGAPVKIRTLAERMISLYQEPDRQPVQIEYIGLRQGEKLYEELLLDNEHVTRTNVEKVFVTKPEHCSWDEVKEKLDILRTCLDEKGDMLACLHETVPAFKPSDTVA